MIAVAQQLINGIMLGAVYMTVAVAFTLTIGILNFLNFTIPGLFMLSAMAAWGVLARGVFGFAGPGAWVLALDPDDGAVVTQLRTRQEGFGSTTGVVREGGRVWLAGIGASAVAYFDVP